MDFEKCPVWGTPARVHVSSKNTDVLRVNSARAGGSYLIDEDVLAKLPHLDRDSRIKLTTWLVTSRANTKEIPHIKSSVLHSVFKEDWLPVVEQRNRFILFLARRCPRINDRLELIDPDVMESDQEQDDIYENLANVLARTECYNLDELRRLADFSAEFVEVQHAPGYMWAALTFAGWERVEHLKAAHVKSDQAFVALWFDETMNDAFDRGFELAVKDAGYRALRIDRKEHNNKIDDEIIAEIRRSRFVIVDFTCDVLEVDGRICPLSRGGVYYEAGFAQSIGLPIIFTCRADMIAHVHFDTRQFAHVIWDTAEDLRAKLSNRISATIGDGPLRN